MRGRLAALVLLAVTASPTFANVCAFDVAPAATLLFPFVVFDYENPILGETTTFAITNVSDRAQVVRVTVWSDLAQPVLGFDVVLAGYDVQTLNIRDILYFGLLPKTGTTGSVYVGGEGQPYPHGPTGAESSPWVDVLPEGESTRAALQRCPPTEPGYPDYGQMSAGTLELIRLGLQASRHLTSRHDLCVNKAWPYDDWWLERDLTDPAWMYVTVDVVQTCGGAGVYEDGYWVPAVDGGQARYDNVLLGDVTWVGPHSIEWDQAVHLEADAQLGRVGTSDPDGQPISFYSRYSTRTGQPSDLREPLPTAWAVRYVGWYNDFFDMRIRVWKGSTLDPQPVDLLREGDDLAAQTCLSYSYYAWDEDANSYWHPTGWPGDPDMLNRLPLAVQEISIDKLWLRDFSGWVLFVWPASNWAGADRPLPDYYQTWMGARYSYPESWDRTGSAAITAAPVANANCFADQVIPHLGIDYDYVPDVAEGGSARPRGRATTR